MDTFYLISQGPTQPLLLRRTLAHADRTMEKRQPPVRVIVPGVIAATDPDATHSFIFTRRGQQVDTESRLCDSPRPIRYFRQQFLGPGVKNRVPPQLFSIYGSPASNSTVPGRSAAASGTAAGGGTCSKCKRAVGSSSFGARPWSISRRYRLREVRSEKKPHRLLLGIASIAWRC